MKITGGRSYIKFDLENGYVMRARGELLAGRQFVVYKDSIVAWEQPHSGEVVTADDIKTIIAEVSESQNENTARIIFE
jgi:hypothetical protein